MKTIKTFFVSFVFLCMGLVPLSAMGQSLPHTFSANTAAKASEVNENFTYLLERFGTRKTTVNCSGGESITTALQNYNHIVISGICSENLSLDATSLPHRLVILEGTSLSSDGISASDTSKEVVNIFNGGITLKATNLEFKNGSYGISAHKGPTVILENVSIKDNSNDGLHLGGGSYGKITDSSVTNNSGTQIWAGYNSTLILIGSTITGNTSSSSIKIFSGSSSRIVNNTIKKGKFGIEVDLGSTAVIGVSSEGNSIQSAQEGIHVTGGSSVQSGYNTINLNSGTQVWIDGGSSVKIEGGSITGNSSNEAIKVNNSTLTLADVTISGGQQGIAAYFNSTVRLEGGNTISGNTENGVRMYNSTMFQYSDDDSTTIESNTDAEIYARRSYLELTDVIIRGSSGSNEIDLRNGSYLKLSSGSSVTGTVNCGNTSPDNGTFVNDSGTSVTTSGC